MAAEDALKPWQHRSWIFPRDPNFAVKATRALDLYAGCWQGEPPLGEDEFVVCADEKTSIQARCRGHPTLPPRKARMMRVEHEYQRAGALAYLAAYDVHRAQVIGRMEPTTGIEPFSRLVAHVMTSEPYASAKRVFTPHRPHPAPPASRRPLTRARHGPGSRLIDAHVLPARTTKTVEPRASPGCAPPGAADRCLAAVTVEQVSDARHPCHERAALTCIDEPVRTTRRATTH